ncbi:MAG: type 1 glutamine amidotransferase [Candidatus Auribacterota bacterium]|jgi:GMP synthase (glutamine-hydrolysing)|nr:type 1 glutamine amidotransferase [Candidatus Auribacterota bacterium]
MRIHYIQHVPFEDTAYIGEWAVFKHHKLTCTKMFENPVLPPADTVDWLIIMGGPMSVGEERLYPWLADEKRYIGRLIEQGKPVVGICLGAQLIANVLGAKVYRNRHKEIGWFPVNLTASAKKSAVFSRLPDSFYAFHWHGDTFDIPSGALWTASSEACGHQAFEYNKNVVGLQFHLESTRESICNLIHNCSADIDGSAYTQNDRQIHLNFDKIERSNILLIEILDEIQRTADTQD